MSERTDELAAEWGDRSKRLGATKRAVLFKRFPGWLNEHIHRRHVNFVARNCPTTAEELLDVGCGYGRISLELRETYPNLNFYGVDLCKEFADEYERTFGHCYHGPIQDFRTTDHFDVIVIVTTLMYLTKDELADVLAYLWSLLRNDGRLICIEPASEMFVLWRRITGRESASPTGGTVQHFTREQLRNAFSHLDGYRISDIDSVRLIPFSAATSVHHCVAIQKKHVD